MDIKDVEKLAELARIDLDESEKQEILKDMDGILGYIKNIEDADVGEVEVSHDMCNIWREDELGDEDSKREDIIKQFPNKKGDYLKVKKIL